jgi:hypothetical protein
MPAAQRQIRICRPLVLTLLVLYVAVVIGCGERTSGQKPNETNLRLVAVLYSQYLSAHGGEVPSDEEEFRTFVSSLGPGVLDRAGLSGLDELFVSARDGQPLVVKYRDEIWPLDGAIAYEQVGANGTRYVASELGGVSEITDEQFLSRHKQPM